MNKVILCIPVMSEAQNLALLLPKVLSSCNGLEILIIDDMSSDNTGELIESLNRHLSHPIIHDYSAVRRGIGNSHILGLKYAFQNNFDYVLTMDGDLTHSPEYIPDLLRVLEKNPHIKLVIGSRFLEKNRLENWTWIRRLMTHGGHLLTRIFLTMNEDCSSGYRAYRVDSIPFDLLERYEMGGYDYFFKSAFIYKSLHFDIAEISVRLNSRQAGESKMRLSDVVKGVTGILVFRLRFFYHNKLRKRFLFRQIISKLRYTKKENSGE